MILYIYEYLWLYRNVLKNNFSLYVRPVITAFQYISVSDKTWFKKYVTYNSNITFLSKYLYCSLRFKNYVKRALRPVKYQDSFSKTINMDEIRISLVMIINFPTSFSIRFRLFNIFNTNWVLKYWNILPVKNTENVFKHSVPYSHS